MLRRTASPAPIDRAAAARARERRAAERRTGRVVEGRRAARTAERRAAAAEADRVAERRSAAAVRPSRRTDSVPRVNRIGTAPAPVRSPLAAAAHNRLAAAGPVVEAAPPNPAEPEAAAARVARTATRPAARDAAAGQRVPADPSPELEAGRTHPPAGVVGLPAQRAPVGPALRTTDRICWWAGSELHSERRRSLRETPGREDAPTAWWGKPAEHTRLWALWNRERRKTSCFGSAHPS